MLLGLVLWRAAWSCGLVVWVKSLHNTPESSARAVALLWLAATLASRSGRYRNRLLVIRKLSPTFCEDRHFSQV